MSEPSNLQEIEQKASLQTISFSIAIVVIILVLISFMRIYSNYKGKILNDMKEEKKNIENIIVNNFSNTRNILDIIARKIQTTNDINRINHILKKESSANNPDIIFGWRKFSWINEDFLEIVSNKKGIIHHPKYINYIRTTINNTEYTTSKQKEKIYFHYKFNARKGSSLKIIQNITDNVKRKHVGSVVVSYDIDSMLTVINKRKSITNTRFVIIDENLSVIAQSQPFIKHTINDSAELDNKLLEQLKKLNVRGREKLEYISIINGTNYFVSHIKGLPFLIIVNTDSDSITQKIIDSFTKIFIEISVLAFACLFIVISIYRREALLRSKAEKAMLIADKATKTKTEFLSFTAHEIRSPLGFILTGSELMIKESLGKLPNEYKEYANGIHKNSKVILDFITDILDENQILEGNFKIENCENNISDILKESIDNIVSSYSNKTIDITFNFGKDLPLLICDKKRILQVMNNLLSNSIKYSKDDNIVIEVIVRIIDNNMEIIVIDQGIGMTKEQIPEALSIYTTTNAETHHSMGSYGLGLPIVKMLLDAHQASLLIESEKNKGTSVKITFSRDKLVYKKPD